MNRDERAAYGPVIREARKAKGLDQQDLADMTGISRRTIGSIERGDTVAQQKPLEKLLAALDLVPHRVDDDVNAFLVVVTPLLQLVSPSRRPQLMQNLTAVVLTEIRTGAHVADLSDWRRVSDPADELPAVADDSAIEEPGENH